MEGKVEIIIVAFVFFCVVFQGTLEEPRVCLEAEGVSIVVLADQNIKARSGGGGPESPVETVNFIEHDGATITLRLNRLPLVRLEVQSPAEPHGNVWLTVPSSEGRNV